MLRTIVVSISNFVCRILEPFRTDYAGCGCVCCEDARYYLRKYEADVEAGLYDFELDGEGNLLDDSLGIDPVKLENGCGCDRPCVSILPCGHCACGCACECGGCPANLIWKDEQESWCGCATPGYEVLPCGHCGCRNGMCLELVRNGSVFEARRKVSCS